LFIIGLQQLFKQSFKFVKAGYEQWKYKIYY